MKIDASKLVVLSFETYYAEQEQIAQVNFKRGSERGLKECLFVLAKLANGDVDLAYVKKYFQELWPDVDSGGKQLIEWLGTRPYQLGGER